MRFQTVSDLNDHGNMGTLPTFSRLEVLMYIGKLPFAQVMGHAPWKTFHRIVNRYRGDHRVKRFTCADQFRCRAFAQRKSIATLLLSGYRSPQRSLPFPQPLTGSRMIGQGGQTHNRQCLHEMLDQDSRLDRPHNK